MIEYLAWCAAILLAAALLYAGCSIAAWWIRNRDRRGNALYKANRYRK